eukprot:CAMPEP_0117006446 /NCGR_PEP_ID=MMETSP0472-20121206/6671_1 /TAXON_ID=693140 ORGANISM="Tiarina fusus, Strain LIS" /NCGR_SAMPLE_ID=MMETSP0472 /ASSEMBLY_ACC=CAM_ASM_000603 /LENGTH=294 /DNA_ID=CAMNT_0004707913 /DNA_START=1 /DNA_END=882 /DNA_ORIENTATION=-
MGKYAGVEEWADITPLEPHEGPNPIVPIAYTDEFKETMNYFRAILQKDERSERAWELTEDVIDQNPANYTAWYYRRILLKELQKDLSKELEFCSETAVDSPKNYQVWHHRRCLVELMNDPSKELEFTEHILDLDEDSKNYHAWAHRQWVLKAYNLWDGELSFVDKKLNEDFRNNSAWNHRYFVVSSTTKMTKEDRQKEIDFGFSWIKKAPNNQSPWNYVVGLVKGMKYSDFPTLKETCEELKGKFAFCTHCSSILVDIYCEEGNEEKALAECDHLISSDVIRSKYWTYRKSTLS